jgi:hypothetical protein
LVIGAQKAATTSLHAYLASHPDVAVPPEKELDFFSRQWDLGPGWYAAQLASAGPARAVGEASPSYAAFPFQLAVPARIRALAPDVRLIYVLRHPVERMRSSYLHALASGTETRPLAASLLADPWYLQLSSYALQLQQYLEHFPREQLLVVRSEDLAARPQAIMARVFDFIGVDPAWAPPNLADRLHVSSVKRVPRRVARAGGTAAVWLETQLSRRPYYPRQQRRSRLATQILFRPVRDEETALDADTADVLARLLRSDLLRLRELLGGEFDLWGLV